ncbi:MAG: PHP domain-containing protein [Euzebyales bacterium]|jgi:predicted metal-dependent phosphoesterase TrpH|nr:PHP domain-containing protein [Euzebyales bacterium]
MAVDLHTHTRHSDGTTSPSENVALAAAAGLDGIALTDHDTTAGWVEAEAACARHGLRFVPGVELSTERAGASVHLLGYWVDADHPQFAAECARLRTERSRRADEVVAKLAALGAPVRRERVDELAGSAPIGRPHIAAALVEAGHVADSAAAFDVFLHDGGPAYVAKRAIDPVAGVRLIRDAGGVAVLAHPAMPGGGDLRPLAVELAAAGLAGIEADHPGHDEEQRHTWREVAAALMLEVTGSSDFHGERTDLRIGQHTTPARALEALAERRPSVTAATTNREGTTW